MNRLLRWPVLPILLIGIVNIPAWYAWAFWGLDRRWSLMALVGLGFVAGWFTQEKLWATIVVLLVPTMFLGGEYHGQPWQWLVYGLLNPFRLAYFAQNMGPVVVAYVAVVGVGWFARLRFRLRRSN
jgi:hypothetical protein